MVRDEDDRLCECGHRKRWHAHDGAGDCEADVRRCTCSAFREYAPELRAAELHSVHRRMLELQLEIPTARERPEGATVVEVIATLVGVSSSHAFEREVIEQMHRAIEIGRTYRGKMGVDAGGEPALLCAVGFLQGVAFARASSDVLAARSE